MRPDLAIPIFTQALSAGERPTIFGNGEQTRDLTYVDDIIAANVKLIKTDKADGKVLNVGGGKRITVNQLYGHLSQIIGSDVKPVYSDKIKGDAEHTLSSCDKAKDMMGYKPETDIESGLKRFVEWFRDNPDFYSVR